MKILMMILMIVLLAAVAAGCSGVVLNAEYSQLLDKTVATYDDIAARAEANSLSPSEMQRALSASAQTWHRFRNARDGVK